MPGEREFLDQQAARAKHNLRQTSQQLTADLLAPLQLRPLVQKHPWWSLGGASAAGMLAGVGLAQQRQMAAARKAAAGGPAAKGPGFVRQGIGKAGFHAWGWLRTVLGTVLMANLRAGSAMAASQANATNGHAHPVQHAHSQRP